MILWSVFAGIIILIDQLTKWLVVNNIKLEEESISIIPKILDFVNIHNPGAAFNILSGRIEILSIISLLFSIGVVWYMLYKKPQNKLFRISAMLLFAGAVGNAVDRIFRGQVVDFIKLAFINFPVFNIADISITCGAALLIIYILFFDEKKEQ